MRNKYFKVITTFLVLIFLSSFFNFLPIDIRKIENFQINTKENKPKASNFWNLTGSPILIDDSDPSKNWSYTASHYDWCSGSGNWTDPYVIENVTINGQGSDNCIEVRNSDSYFIIRNCSLYNSGSSYDTAGIKLYTVDNGKIINNNCSDNYWCGIYLDSSNNNTISGNTANNSNYGIRLLDSNNNALSGNAASYNSFYGIILSDSNNNTLSGNTANSNNNNYGIRLYDSDNNTLSGNTANNNNYGIYLELYSDNNTLSGNTINYNKYGIYLEYSDNNTLSGNAANNNDYGITLLYSNNNTLSGNLMNFCGILVSGSLVESASQSIDDTNLVNNKPVYYYVNEIGLGSSDFTNAGQIILVNCNNSIISGLNLSNGTFGIDLKYSNNNTLSGNIANNNYYGIRLYYSNNNTLSGNTASYNKYRGIYLWNSNNNTLSGNTANNNGDYGIYLLYSNNNTLSGNVMNLGGITIYGSKNEMTSQNIDNSNLLNNKPIYYYSNEIGLKPNDFLNAGQIILINCNDSLISGVNISNCYHGIYIDYSNNNTIEDNIVNNNIYNGITMKNSFNIILSKNNVNFNLNSGIYITCSNITLWNNTASNNQGYGIYASGDNNFVIENEANNNKQSGIKIEGDHNTIVDNRAFNNNDYGIYMIGLHNNASRNTMKNCGITAAGPLEWRSTCFVDTSNTVNEKPVYFYNNEIGLNSYNFSNAGQVQLNNCSNSVISNLNMSNTTIGISIFIGNNNTISGNIANNNNYFGLVFSGDNFQITGNIMNNNKKDGMLIIGDNNTISGNTLNNNKNRGIIVESGSNDNLFYRNIFDGNGFNAEDRGVNNKWDNGIIGNYWDDYTGIDENKDGIGDSPYFILRDSYDNFPILDITIPDITIHKPINEETYGFHAPEFNVEIKDPHLDKMWYKINNGATSIIFTSNGTINQALWAALPEGNVVIKIYANDSIGNIGFTEVTIKKDVTAPIITINNPQNNDVIGATAPSFNISINEPNLDTVWYSLNGGTNITFTGLTGTINQALWDALPEGNVIIKFYANNSIGNIGFQEVTVVKEITQLSPPGIPGYNLLFLFGIISVIVVIVIKKRIKNIWQNRGLSY